MVENLRFKNLSDYITNVNIIDAEVIDFIF